MRPCLLAILGCALVIGCAPAPQFPTPEQNVAAVKASQNDKSERIKPEVLRGMWIGDKGSVLSFGPDHRMSYRRGVAGKSSQGEYKLKGYHLSLNEKSLGNVLFSKPDQLMLAVTREQFEKFRKFAE
jgi:hypothetical protein